MGRLRKSASPPLVEPRWLEAGVMRDGAGVAFFALDPGRLFGAPAPLEIELGAGRGDFILERAQAHPEFNFLAVELSGSVFRELAARCALAAPANLRVMRADARALVNTLIGPAS